MFVGKAWSLPFEWSTKRGSNWVGSSLPVHYEISGLYYKTFRIIIYDHNDGTIIEPVL